MADIHYAAQRGNVKRVRTLLNQGVNVNTRNQYGYTPLHNAADRGRMNVVRELLRRGANFNARTKGGLTPLKIAVDHRKPTIVRMLVNHGAKISIRNRYGRTPLNMIIERKRNATANARNNASRSALFSRAATAWRHKVRQTRNRVKAMRNSLSENLMNNKGKLIRRRLPAHVLNIIEKKMRQR